jgi:two-component sensor histidine kinase
LGIASISRQVVTLTHIYDSLLGIGLTSTIDLSKYLRELCSSLPKLQDGRTGNVDLECHVESMMVPLDSATALGMAVAELVTNGYRHAFPDDREGTIVVTAIADDSNAILMIRDDGVGFDTTAATSRRGLGLVRQLVEQIGGTVCVRSEVGTLWTLIFPLSDSTGGLAAAA